MTLPGFVPEEDQLQYRSKLSNLFSYTCEALSKQPHSFDTHTDLPGVHPRRPANSRAVKKSLAGKRKPVAPRRSMRPR
jgi:hypothetical protein